MKFIDLNKQKKRIENSLNHKIKKIIDEGKYIMGPEVFELEESLTLFEEGMSIVEEGKKKLDEAELKIKKLTHK